MIRKSLLALAALALAAAAALVLLTGWPKGNTAPESLAARQIAPPNDAAAQQDALPQDALPQDALPKEHDHAHEVVTLTKDQVTGSNIEVAPATGGTLYRRLDVPATITLDSVRVARAPARVIGTVTQLRKRLGDTVTKGEIVALLDSREAADAKTEFLTASVTFDLQKTLFERAKVLWGKKVSSEQQYLQAEASYLEARLRLDLARQKLSALDLDATEVEGETREDSEKAGSSRLRQYPVRSPISGRIIETKVDVGTAVGSQGEPADLYTIADVSKLWIELSVPTGELSAIDEGQGVEIARGKATERGRIIFVSPMLDPATRSARVIAEIDNKDGIWRPGTFVTASILIGAKKVGILLPRSAVQTIEGVPAVFVKNGDEFEKRSVKLGQQDYTSVEIVSGISAGEQVAIDNTFVLKAELGKDAGGEGHDH
jgi:cobalt-zinc-cadmium efflux system membrane fusion protein